MEVWQKRHPGCASLTCLSPAVVVPRHRRRLLLRSGGDVVQRISRRVIRKLCQLGYLEAGSDESV